MKIWIDLANSPHILFFKPIISGLKSQNNDVCVTIRDFVQTVDIAEKYEIEGKIIGKHGGKQNAIKLLNLINRSFQLMACSIGKNIDIAVSHNSYTHTVAGRLIRSKVVTLMDYEGQPANHIAFRFAHKVIVPDCFPDKDLKRFGANLKKVYKYHGFKEQVYLSYYKPDLSFKADLIKACSLPDDWNLEKNILVTVRTPATTAAYHHYANPIFESLLEKLNRMSDLTVIILPRTIRQKSYIINKYPGLIVPEYPLFGSDLIYHSDLVISAGGTMNREASILGTPVYTIFSDDLPAVDRKLIEMGSLVTLSSESSINKLTFEKKVDKGILKNPTLCKEIIEEIKH